MEPIMTYRIPASLPEAESRVRAALKDQGFGILTEVDVTATLREKLGEETIPYRILGACNPALAHRAMGLVPAVGSFLPCGIALFESKPGETTVALQNPEMLGSLFAVEGLGAVAVEAAERLSIALAAAAGRDGDAR